MTVPQHATDAVDRADLPDRVAALLASGHDLVLVAGHDDGDAGLRVVHTFARPGGGVRELAVSVPRDDAWVPTLAGVSFTAGRFEREVRDLFGVEPRDHPQPRRLVHHAHWPEGWYPMRADAGPPPPFGPDLGSFPFVEVEGDGVYEIPVGPVHAGLIEPGHFRFSVVGETIIRMKARLWFVHRGVEKLFEGRRPADALGLAERISGDTAVGHATAFAAAVEAAAGLDVAPEDRLVRALLLELERMHAHVGDLGALPNDVGFGIAHAHALRLRERLLRLNKAVTGHRLLRGGVTIGGTQGVVVPDPAAVGAVAAEVAELVDITLGHSVVRDRFGGTAVLRHDQALTLGVRGYVARGSGVAADARADHPSVDLGEHFRVCVETSGDVMARYLVRAREFAVSAAVVSDIAQRLGGGGRTAGTGRSLVAVGPGAGVGIVEAWRGAAVHRVEIGPDGRLTRVKVVDPSFVNWPGLPVALADTIVPDFPLANKSFDQSYAGNDL